MTAEREPGGHAVPGWLAPGVNRCLVDGAWRLLALDSRMRALLDGHLAGHGPWGSPSYEAERGRRAAELYRLEDEGTVLFIDDGNEQNNKRIKAMHHGK